jgi:hypothetical protein
MPYETFRAVLKFSAATLDQIHCLLTNVDF